MLLHVVTAVAAAYFWPRDCQPAGLSFLPKEPEQCDCRGAGGDESEWDGRPQWGEPNERAAPVVQAVADGGVAAAAVAAAAAAAAAEAAGRRLQEERQWLLEQEPCRSDPCQNGGQCIEGAAGDPSGDVRGVGDGGRYFCLCTNGWSGVDCLRRVASASRPSMASSCGPNAGCLNGGSCIDASCVCRSGFAGFRCADLYKHDSEIERQINQELDGWPRPIVDDGRSDPSVLPPLPPPLRHPPPPPPPLPMAPLPRATVSASGAANTAVCARSPCQHGGVCSADRRGPLTDWQYVEGKCTAGYTPISHDDTGVDGAAARLDQLVCEWCIASIGASDGHRISGKGYGSPLKIEAEANPGSVSDHVCKPAGAGDDTGRYLCACKPGWAGPECQDDFDECASHPCQNGAKCFESASQMMVVPDPMQPELMGLPADMLLSDQPAPPVGRFRCECADQHFGALCEHTHQQCQSSPCQHGGSCTPVTDDGGAKTYSCSCAKGWTGNNCEEDVDECAALTPCANAGTCVESGALGTAETGTALAAGVYLCICKSGWGGDTCAIDSARYGAEPLARAALAAPSACGLGRGQGGYFGGDGGHVAFPLMSGVVDAVSIRLWMRAFSLGTGLRPILSTTGTMPAAAAADAGSGARTGAAGMQLCLADGELKFELIAPAGSPLSAPGHLTSWERSAHTFAWRPMPNTWYRVAVIYGRDDVDGFVDLFVDGRLVESACLETAQIELSRLMLGRAPASGRGAQEDGQASTFHGMLAAVELSQSISTSQVENCDGKDAKEDDGLLGSWSFALGEKLIDGSKHARDGVLADGVKWSPPIPSALPPRKP
eukprot:SAG22_NODE_731_length_7588_cov_6.237281_6_plen_831_part_00